MATSASVVLTGGTSGTVTLTVPLAAGAGTLTLPSGLTDTIATLGTAVNQASQFTFTNTMTFSNTIVIAKTIAANGASNTGTSGYVLTSGGASTNVYWAAVSGTTNVLATYSWTNTHSFSNTITFSSNAVINSTAYHWVGNTTTSPTIRLANTGSFTIGNNTTTQTASVISVANTVGNVQITPTSITTGGTINAFSHTVSTSFVANSLGVYTTGVVNTAAITGLSNTLVLAGNSSKIATILTNAAETTNVSATAATGTISYYVASQSVLYYTTAASANWTPNVAFSATTTLNNAMAPNQTITIAFLVTQGSTPYYSSDLYIDGTAVTPKWQGGSAPSAGNADGVDMYTYTIIKTGTSTYTAFASVTQFK